MGFNPILQLNLNNFEGGLSNLKKYAMLMIIKFNKFRRNRLP